MKLPERVTLVEVGPRDGLQNTKTTLPVSTRIQMIEQLRATGLTYIEAGSFVSEEKVPQMAKTEEVFSQITKTSNVHYPALVPNLFGLKKAIAAGVKTIAIFGSASETFCQNNINCSVQESIQRFEAIISEAKQHNMLIRGYLSCIAGCPYEGNVPIEKTALLAEKLIQMGCYEISLGDTIGTGTPNQITQLIHLVSKKIPIAKLAVHFHDTYGQALANIYAALQCGINVVDASVAGLGGCPYAKGASGNVSTEDVLYMLNGLGIKTGVHLEKLIETSHFICKTLACENHSRVALAMQKKVSKR